MTTFPGTLEKALLSSANHNAANAFRDRGSKEFDIYVGAAIAAGSAVELFLKYLLALKHPLHLQELRPKSPDSALLARELLSEPSIPYSISLSNVKSISAWDALKLASHLHKDLELASLPLNVALQVRNSAAHLAVGPQRDLMDDAIYAVVMLFKKAYDLQLISSFPIPNFLLVTLEFLNDYRERRVKFIREKISETKRSARMSPDPIFEELSRIRDETSWFLDQMRREIEGGDDLIPPYRGHYRYGSQKCIACKDEGMVICEATGDVDVDEIDGELREVPITVLSPYAFACSNCGLTLSHTELQILSGSGDQWATHLLGPSAVGS